MAEELKHLAGEGWPDVRLLNTKALLAFRFLSFFPFFFSADSHERALKKVFIRGLVVLGLYGLCLV